MSQIPEMKTAIINKVAVLLFANSAEEDTRRKSLHDATELFTDLNKRTMAVITKSGLRCIHVNEESQKGIGFGERFGNAIRDVFNLGYEYVITVGNDSPGLKSSHILKALEALQHNKVVLGPSLDGGFYLMGLHQSQFSEGQFKELPWQTSNLRQAFVELMEAAQAKVSRLRLLRDLDSWEDLVNYSGKFYNIPISIVKYVNQQLDKVLPFIQKEIFGPSNLFFTTYYNKGSPLFISATY